MYLLALTEFCQRFAFWGTGYLLVLFFVTHFSFTVPKATQLFGMFTGLSFFLPILGGILADKWNYKSPITIGIVLTAIGCFFLATLYKPLIIPALLLISFGAGCITPSIYSLLGTLYADKQHLREGGFSIYYCLVNGGVLLALLVLGLLQQVSWRATFIVSGSVVLLGLIPYSFALKKLKHIQIASHYFSSLKVIPFRPLLKHHEKDRVFVILILTVISTLFWIAYNQAGSSMTLFALNYTNRVIGGFQIPVPWFIATGTFFLIIFAFPFARLYLYLRKLRSNASPPMKTALSLFFMGLCFLVMQRAAAHIPVGADTGSISPFYLFSAFGLMALAELFLAPIGLSLVTNLSPHRYRGLLTGLWFSSIGIGFYLGGFLAKFFTEIKLTTFFDFFVFASFLPALALVLFSKKLDHMRHIDSL